MAIKTLIIVEHHMHANIHPLKGIEGGFGLVVRPGTAKDVRVYQMEDDGQPFEIREKLQTEEMPQSKGGEQDASRSDSESSQ